MGHKIIIGAAAGSDKSHKHEEEAAAAATADTPLLKEAMDEQIFSFKENIVNEQFLPTSFGKRMEEC